MSTDLLPNLDPLQEQPVDRQNTRPHLRIVQQRQEQLPEKISWQELTPQYFHPSYLLLPEDRSIHAIVLGVRFRAEDKVAILTLDLVDKPGIEGSTWEVDTDIHHLIETPNEGRYQSQKQQIQIVRTDTNKAVKIIELRQSLD